MDHRMEQRERGIAEEASVNNPRTNGPKKKETVTLCPLRIQDDDC